jgi:hypothetical protein
LAPTHRHVLIAGAVLTASAVLAGCVTTTPAATPVASAPVVATPVASAVPTAATTTAPTPSTAPSVQASVPASAVATAVASPLTSPGASQLAITTPVPGSSLDPSLSDAGVVGRLTIAHDTRPDRIGTDDHTGTSEILGRSADGSDCSFSLGGDDFTAVASYDDAPNGMLHQMAVSVSTDFVPANDGEQRAGVSDGRVYADFSSESGFGTAYSGDSTEETNGGTSTIDIERTGDTLVFTFTGTTWDEIDFSGQMMCSGMTE